MKPTINIIGAGRLGKTIAKLIVSNDVGTIQGICNRSPESAEIAIQFIGQGKAFVNLEDLPPSDITFITTPDEDIKICCEKLSHSKKLKEGSIVVHCSGCLSSNVLHSVKQQGCLIASVHPMRSFANSDISFSQYHGTYCAIEGNLEACRFLSSIFDAIGSITYNIDSHKKGTYHASGVFASNYLVTTVNIAIRCLKNAGVNNDLAFQIVISLIKGTLDNLETTLSPEKSLTGPIKRGDIDTIIKHLNSLPNRKVTELYRILGLATVDIANLPQGKKEAVEKILSSPITKKKK